MRYLYMDKDKHMAQFSVIVPDDLGELINQISKETGRSISSLCADYLQEGVYRHVEQLNRVEVWRSQTNERQKSKRGTNDHQNPAEAESEKSK